MAACVLDANAPRPRPAPPLPQEKLKALKKEYGSKSLGNVLVEQAIGGMRGIPVRPCLRTPGL